MALRIWGRTGQLDGNQGGTWVAVTTDANGDNADVYLTNLAQVLKLNLNESPFWANYGIPAQQSVVTQVWPTYYSGVTQAQFAPFFASLIITPLQGTPEPVYNVVAVAQSGAVLNAVIAT
jgi:hypothetical protein